MTLDLLPQQASCPDPFARATRLSRESDTAQGRIHLAPAVLQGAIVAVITRDTRGLALNDAQRLTHFPASPLVSLSAFQDMNGGLVERTADAPRWQPFSASVMLSGSQSQPTVSWSPAGGRGCMICFTADTARSLFGLDLAAVQDRCVPAQTVLGELWQPLLQALLDAPDDAATLAVLQQHLATHWQALQGRASAMPSLRQIGRHWVERLGLQAHEWRNTHSARQVERRIKAHSGRSLREWQLLVKTESVFFNARDRYDAGESVDWAALALDEGFADQAHLSRTAKRITGFSPGEFAQRFAEDESFWLYRLWV
ncbi:helix-turn-helix domain-containing protein [Paraburkholderia bryophila]|uniref:AraC-like DNA-binding protein n=1 Tax=Paraburkholderia bryophila TaxID=420952 RepID=A0A7Z0BA18_9BURK|nr:helix-turn-helix domain-containing protein [Paraburkholderia bryophila]NYH24937.1 AraC-like DNA-binding protein [Paraburkholderia bryophila]